jgi:hypothetical protein
VVDKRGVVDVLVHLNAPFLISIPVAVVQVGPARLVMIFVDVRCSAIEGILHRYHRCGPIFMLEDKGNYRGSSLRMAFRIFRYHRAPKTNEGSLDTSFGDLKPT